MPQRKKREWAPREMRLLSEWLAAAYPYDTVLTRVRVGNLPKALITPDMPEWQRRMVGIWRRWVDAIVVTKDKLILVEAAIRPDPGDVSKIEAYAMLIPHTPELEAYKALPIDKVLLYSIEDPLTVTLARRQGIRCIYYHPPWLDEYLETLYPRERQGHLV